MSIVKRLATYPIKAKGELNTCHKPQQDFTNKEGVLYYFEKEREKRLNKKIGVFILDTKTRFNNVSDSAEAREELFIKLAQELGFGEMVGDAVVRAAARDKKREQRARMTSEGIADDRAKSAERMKAHRAQMSPDQVAMERTKARERRLRRRAAQLNP